LIYFEIIDIDFICEYCWIIIYYTYYWYNIVYVVDLGFIISLFPLTNKEFYERKL